MLEMTVRTVDHDPRSGSPVALLLPRDRADAPPMALPIRSAEACWLIDHHPANHDIRTGHDRRRN
jgi:hypothetical protein